MSGVFYVIFSCVSAVLVSAAPLADDKHDIVPFHMPGVQPQYAETYLCYAKQLDDSRSVFITGFEPKANMSTAHHILIYGCTEPGDTVKTWNCGEMAANQDDTFEQGPVCRSGAKIVYAWAMDAPDLHLPPGVAFEVGGDTDIKWLVLQVHYKDVSQFVPPNNGKDESGVDLITTFTQQPKRAGVYLLGTGGSIPPHSTTYMETACSYNEPMDIHPFAFRGHAHTHGEVVAGFRVRDGKWQEIGRVSPKRPQMFYNVTDPSITIKPGDILAARCTMVNDEDRQVYIGNTGNDEMCNFYMMYWVDGDHIMKNSYCFTEGPPGWNWGKFPNINADGAPMNASIVPGTDKLLKASEKLLENSLNAVEEAEGKIEDEFLELLRDMQAEGEYENPAVEELRQEEEALLPYLNQEEDRYMEQQGPLAYPVDSYDQESYQRTLRGLQDPYDLLQAMEQNNFEGYPY